MASGNDISLRSLRARLTVSRGPVITRVPFHHPADGPPSRAGKDQRAGSAVRGEASKRVGSDPEQVACRILFPTRAIYDLVLFRSLASSSRTPCPNRPPG